MTTTRTRRTRQTGAGIVETMIGILIGMIVVLVIYNVFALAEGYKRTAVGAADAQTTGLYAQFVLSREIASAGNGLLVSGIATIVRNLQQCSNNTANWTYPSPPFAALAPQIRPIPVLIHDGGANVSDSLIVTYGASPHVASPVQFVDQSGTIGGPAGGPIYVQSPNGFRAQDWVIATGRDLITGNVNCELALASGVVPGDAKGVLNGGVVEISLDPKNATAKDYAAAPDTNLLSLGRNGEAVRALYDVANDQLRSTDLFTAGATANPIAQNVVLMKAQYGIDCAANGVVVWTNATASNACGLGDSYVEAEMVKPSSTAVPSPNDAKFGAAGATLARIRAIRIGIVVRSDEPDLKDPALKNQTAVLFDCSTHDAACQGRITLNKAVLTDGWRFRYYETVIPMRNAIWNTGT